MPADPVESPSTYLSIVLTSRNDGHGGNPLARLQAFVNTFDAQCRQFGLDAEVIVVEWNPPADRPRLHDVIRRPAHCAFDIRFIEVPEALHLSLPHPHVMPLFQMIGKNVGIRRSRGRFVLCTNIDIIFSNELVEFFAARSLRPGVMYRVDRHDIESDYPVDSTLEQQQEYCRRHHLRIHRSFGSFPVDPLGRLTAASPDVFETPGVEIHDGWHVREGEPSLGYYRWASEHATMVVNTAAASFPAGAVLALELEPNPYDPASWFEIDVNAGARLLAHARIADRQILSVPLPETPGRFEVEVRTVAAAPQRAGALPAFERRSGLAYRLRSARLKPMPLPFSDLEPYDMGRWRTAHRDARSETAPDGLAVASAAANQSYCLRYGPFRAATAGRFTFAIEYSVLDGNLSLHVVDEIADRWLPAVEHEMVVGKRRRIFVAVNLKPSQVCSLYVANRYRGGDGVSKFVMHAISGSSRWTALDPRGRPDGLLQSARLVAVKGIRRVSRSLAPRERNVQPPVSTTQTAATGDGSASPPAAPARSLTARIEEYAATHPLPPTHRNGAGDFQLMARENWFAIQGYAEFTMYSMNIDGLLGDAAHYAGIEQEILEMPRCIYHLEHSVGSGWTPEGEGKLRQRLSESGADWLDASTVDLWSTYMDWLCRPMLFNGPDWGFGGAVLRETALPALVDHS